MSASTRSARPAAASAGLWLAAAVLVALCWWTAPDDRDVAPVTARAGIEHSGAASSGTLQAAAAARP